MCNEKLTVQHLVSESEKLAQHECNRRHDNVAKCVHWKLCEKFPVVWSDKWYEHTPKGSVENENVQLLWDMKIQCDNIIEARRPDIVLVGKKEKRRLIVDIAVPLDVRWARRDSSKLWSSQLWTQFKQLRREAWKSQDVNGVWTRDLARDYCANFITENRPEEVI